VQGLLSRVAQLMAKKNLPGLMISGHAVTALGHPRATFDLDLIIPRAAAVAWREALMGLSYRIFAESENFHQYEAGQEFPLAPVDLMLVDDDVYEVLAMAKRQVVPIATPSVEAMIALKLHAAKHRNAAEAERDWSDLIALMRIHQLSLDDASFAAMVERHGGTAAIERIQKAFAQ
jgi:hypothetical protein